MSGDNGLDTRPRMHVEFPSVTDEQSGDPWLRTATPQDIYEIFNDECANRLHRDIDIRDVLALDDYYDEHERKNFPERVRHELAMQENPIGEQGISKAAMPLWKLLGTIRYAIDQFEKQLNQEQPGMTWRMVGFRALRKSNTTTIEVPYTGPRHSIASIQTAALEYGITDRATGGSRPVALERRIDYAEDRDWRAILQVIYADVARGMWRDPNLQHEPTWDGPGIRYATTRALRHMSDGQRRRRELIVKELRRLYRLDEVKASRPEQQMVVDVVRSPADDPEIRERVLRLRKGPDGEFLKPGQIARRAGVSLEIVQNILLAASKGDEHAPVDAG